MEKDINGLGISVSSGIDDSGQRTQYDTGALRDNKEGKGRFDLMPALSLLRVAKWYEKSEKKYPPRNWESGLPISRCIDAAIRHSLKYLAGWDDEDHLAAVVWNILAIMFYESYKPEMQDLPLRKDKLSKWTMLDTSQK